MTNFNFKEFFQSKTFRGILYSFGLAAVLFLTLGIGMRVGEHRAEFSDQWGGNFRRTFGAPPMMGDRGGMMGGFLPGNFTESHGVAGKIIKIALPTVVIEGTDKVEKIVLLKDDTVIRQFRADLKSSDLKVDDMVVVIGSPNTESQIEARLVRVLPQP